MKQTNLLRLGLAALVALLVVGSGTLARAGFVIANDVADGTYVFTASDGHTQLDGSWVKFRGDSITDWKLVDTTVAAETYWPLGYYPFFPPLTPWNSSIINALVYPNGTGPNAFSFQIGSPGGVGSANDSIFWFGGQNNLNGFSALYDGHGNGAPVVDPEGKWTAAGTVPDASDTWTLLVGALISVGTCRYLVRVRVAARA